MANINKIKLSGTTYNIQDLSAAKTVELTQAQYDALTVKDPNTFYIITDAEGADLSNYYTKSETSGATEISTALNAKADTATTYTKTETDNAITASTSTKQDTLVSGTNIKTINNESILGSGNIDIQGGGGSITIDTSLDSGSTNAVANSAITTAFNSCYGTGTYWDMVGSPRKNIPLRMKKYGTNSYDIVALNLGSNLVYGSEGFQTLSVSGVVETSAITTSISSASTDSQVPSAKAVYDMVGNINTILESI